MDTIGTIKLKKNDTVNSQQVAVAPLASELEFGELAINYNPLDPCLFFKDKAGNIVKIVDENVIVDTLKDILGGAATDLDTLKELLAEFASSDLATVQAQMLSRLDQLDIDVANKADRSALNAHINNTSNPHGVTAAQVGAYYSGNANKDTVDWKAKTLYAYGAGGRSWRAGVTTSAVDNEVLYGGSLSTNDDFMYYIRMGVNKLQWNPETGKNTHYDIWHAGNFDKDSRIYTCTAFGNFIPFSFTSDNQIEISSYGRKVKITYNGSSRCVLEKYSAMLCYGQKMYYKFTVNRTTSNTNQRLSFRGNSTNNWLTYHEVNIPAGITTPTVFEGSFTLPNGDSSIMCSIELFNYGGVLEVENLYAGTNKNYKTMPIEYTYDEPALNNAYHRYNANRYDVDWKANNITAKGDVVAKSSGAVVFATEAQGGAGNLFELGDVDIPNNPTDNFVLMYNAKEQKWVANRVPNHNHDGLIYASDENLKEGIVDMRDAMVMINNMKPKTYHWNKAAEELNLGHGKAYGLIAQEIETICPELVKPIAGTPYKGIDYVKIIPILISAIQEQNEVIAKTNGMLRTYEKRQNKAISDNFSDNKRIIELEKQIEELKQIVYNSFKKSEYLK